MSAHEHLRARRRSRRRSCWPGRAGLRGVARRRRGHGGGRGPHRWRPRPRRKRSSARTAGTTTTTGSPAPADRDARRAGDRRRSPTTARAPSGRRVGRAALGGHARRRRPVAGRGRNGPPPARRRRRRGAAAPAGGGAVIAVERGFALEDPDGTLTALDPVWTDAGGPDERGRLRPRRPLLVRLDGLRPAPGRRRAVPARPRRRRRTACSDGVTISNGLEWSPDGSLAYYADTATAPRRRLRLRPGRRADRPASVRAS